MSAINGPQWACRFAGFGLPAKRGGAFTIQIAIGQTPANAVLREAAHHLVYLSVFGLEVGAGDGRRWL
jgi:hypothetical protein